MKEQFKTSIFAKMKFYGLNPEHTLTLEEITALLMASICLNEEEFNALPLRLQQLFTELK